MNDGVLMQRALQWTEGFAAWPEKNIQSLLLTARLARFARGETIHEETEATTSVMVAGHAMVRRIRSDGTKVTLELIGPGRVFGLAAVDEVDNGSRFEITAHGDALVIQLDSQALLSHLDAEPSLWPVMARVLLRQQREAWNSLVDHATGSLRERLAATVDRLATLYAVYDRDGLGLQLRLSQEDLAAILQVSRQTVNKELRVLENAGVVTAEYSALTIRDRNALRRVAGKWTAPN